MAVWNSMLQKIIIIPLGVVWQHVRFIGLVLFTFLQNDTPLPNVEAS
jgi:hypothetical protein